MKYQKMNLAEFEEYDKVFDFIAIQRPEWEKLVTDNSIKIKTNQHKIQFDFVEQILKKFNLRISDVSYTDYYGIILGIEKL